MGKTTLVNEFARREYAESLLIDFSQAPPAVTDIFEHYGYDTSQLLDLLQAFYNVRLPERETLIIFDEVQRFPRARQATKHLVEDGRFDYITTGSLISIRKNVQDILIPSEEQKLELGPCDFEEFCSALGEDLLYQTLVELYDQHRTIPDLLHRRGNDLWRRYLLIGGMPQAINEYAESNDLEQVHTVKQRILDLYYSDIEKYTESTTEASRVRAIYRHIPAELSKHEKKLVLSEIDTDARMREYDPALYWLTDARFLNMCLNVTDPSVGLGLNLDLSSRKYYSADTGLLVSQVLEMGDMDPGELYREVLFGDVAINEGMLTENVVAQQLRANGDTLAFYSSYDDISANRMEIDFLLVRGYSDAAGKSRISPVEVKSGQRFRTTSLDKFRKKFHSRVGTEYVVSTKPLRFDDENHRVYLPFYLTGQL